MSSDRPITLAVIIGAHGVTGEVRLKLFTEDLKPYKSLTGAGRSFTLKSIRPGPNGAVARFAEIADRNEVEALRGTELTVPRSALPPLGDGEYYHIDLIGLPCIVAGQSIGSAVLVEDFGAGDVLEIEKPDGKRFMVPVARAVTIEADRLLIDPEFVEWNPITIFLVIGSLYLVIVAYGVVGTCKRGLPMPVRITAAAVQVVLPPVILLGVMSLEPKLFLLASWAPVIGMLMLAGALLAICTDIVARRVL